MGFAEEEAVDRKRASFLTASGGFNADAFGGAILRSRVNTAAAVSGVRVVPPTIFAGVGLAHLDDLKDMYEASRASFELNMATHPWTIAMPLCAPSGLTLATAPSGLTLATAPACSPHCLLSSLLRALLLLSSQVRHPAIRARDDIHSAEGALSRPNSQLPGARDSRTRRILQGAHEAQARRYVPTSRLLPYHSPPRLRLACSP